MRLGKLVKDLSATILSHRRKVAWGAGLITAGITLPFLDLESFPKVEWNDLAAMVQATWPLAAPIATYAITNTCIGLAKTTKGIRRKELPPSRPDLPDLPGFTLEPKKSNIAIVGTGLGYLAHSIATSPDAFTFQQIETALPGMIALGLTTQYIIKSFTRRQFSERLWDFSVLTGGLSYYAIANLMNPPLNSAAILMSPGIIAYTNILFETLFCKLTAKQKKQLYQFTINPTREFAKTRDLLGKSVEYIYLPEYLRTGQYDELFRISAEMLEETPVLPLLVNAVFRYTKAQLSAVNFIARKLSPHAPEQEILAAGISAMGRDPRGAKEHLRRAKILAQHFEHPLLSEILTLESVATGNWDENLPLILKDMKDTAGTLQQGWASSESVQVIDPEKRKFLSSFYVFKQHRSREPLESELARNQEIATCLPEEYGTVTPLHLTQEPHDGQFCYVTRYEQGITLDQSKDITDYRKTARSLGIIHKSVKSKRGRRNYRAVLEERFAQGVLDEVHPDLYSSWDFLWRKINGIYYDDQDPQGKNRIVTPQGRLIILDTVDKGETDQCIQLAKLTESSTLFRGNVDTRIEMYREYSSECETVEIKPLLEGVLAATPIVAINAYFYSSQGRADSSMTQTYLQNAHWALRFGQNELGWQKYSVCRMTKIICALGETSCPL